MIRFIKLMFLSGLDLKLEAQNWGFLRISAEGTHASRQTRFLAGHDIFSVDHLSTMRGCPLGRTQDQGFFCLDQFFTMAFAQLTYRESLRDIEVNTSEKT
jgi:hypothetical protein